MPELRQYSREATASRHLKAAAAGGSTTVPDVCAFEFVRVPARQPERTDLGDVPAFSIAVPGDWIVMDLERACDPDVVATTIDERIDDGSIGLAARDEAIELVVRLIADAREGGVMFAAALIAEDETEPLVVSFTVAAMRFVIPELEEMSEDDLDVDPASGHGDRGGIRFTDSAMTQVVLAAGPAGRIERTTAHQADAQIAHGVYSIQYVVPVDEDGLAFTMTGISPAIRRRNEVDKVLSEIADTLEIERA